jgi:outer membrane receptor protein involved in Fe transport
MLKLHTSTQRGPSAPVPRVPGLPAGRGRVWRLALAAAAVGVVPGAYAQAVPTSSDLDELEMFTSTGQGESRATNAITFEDLQTKIPGLSLEKSLDAIPGVNVRSTDPFGFYEFGNDIRVRSFDVSRLAVTVDDVPMGSNSPRYGTPAGRVSDPENMMTIRVSQGTGDVTTAAAEALGGSIMYYTRDPSREPGALVKWSVGDFSAQRVFARFETGEILPGLTAFVSTSQFRFKSTGVPDYSESKRIEAKVLKRFEKGSLAMSYTWNDRDDFDTRNIQWDRWRALETGDPYAGYPRVVYGDTGNADLEKMARGGYRNYSSFDPPADRLSDFLLGDYSDHGRVLGPLTYFDPRRNLGDPPNSQYYLRWRNGRMDHFLRSRLSLEVSESVRLLSTAYYQDKNNYGLFPVSRGDSRTQIQNAYVQTNRNRTAAQGWIDRPDIWPQYLFHDGSGNLVPIGTPGAVPVGYTDVNGDGFYSTGDTLNFSATPNPFTSGHALAVRGGTAPALNGATARDEEFGGKRFGTTQRVEWRVGNQRIRAGFWVERDEQSAFRPTYMLEGDSPSGAFLYDRILFLNYDQNFQTTSFIAFIDDQIRFMEGRLNVNLGAKFMNVKREAEGQLTTPTWWRNERAARGGTFRDTFLPQLGATFALNPKIELFGSYAENLAAPDYGVIASDTFTSALKPERSENFDFGLRFSGGAFNATLAGFVNLYKDRILSIALTQEELIAAGLSGVTGVTNFRNVGGITATGAEFAFDWRTPIERLVIVGSVAHQKATFDDDIRVGTAAFHSNANDPRSQFYDVLGNGFSLEKTSGKRLGNTPNLTTSLDARYSLGGARFSLGGKYYGPVFVNTLNTERLPSYTIFNGSVAYGFSPASRLAPFTMTVSVDNLFDQKVWYAGAYNGSFNGNLRADYGRNVTFTVSASF